MPDVRPIVELHRGNDGYVAFQRKTRAGVFEPLLSVKASELGNVFPEFISPHVDEESFYTINSMHLAQRHLDDRSSIDAQFPKASWGNKQLRYLTACYMDLDCYRLGITVGQCIGGVIDAQDRGDFPPASIITRSGQGVWLFWMLRDDDNEQLPVRAWPEKISTYRRIERKLLPMFARLGADAAAVDPSRITRVPGSLHHKSDKRVAYWVQLDNAGRAISYRIDELAKGLGIKPAEYPKAISRAINPKYVERARKGYAKLHSGRLNKLLSLFAWRGFIAEGGRNHAALLLATFLRCCKTVDDAELIDTVEKFGRFQCRPALSKNEIADAITSSKIKRKFSDYTVGDWLKITPEESGLIGWPAENTRPMPGDELHLKTRQSVTEARRKMVRTFIDRQTGGRLPTLEQISDFVEVAMGTKPSTQTIAADLKWLGIPNPRAWHRADADKSPKLLPEN